MQFIDIQHKREEIIDTLALRFLCATTPEERKDLFTQLNVLNNGRKRETRESE